MSRESQAKDCPIASLGRAWTSRKGSPRAPGECLALLLLPCSPMPLTGQLLTPVHPPNYRALSALGCLRAQLWHKEPVSSPVTVAGLLLLLWRTLAWSPASLTLTVFPWSSLDFGLVDAPAQTSCASETGWPGQLWPSLWFLTCRGNLEYRVCLVFRYVRFGAQRILGAGDGKGKEPFRTRVNFCLQGLPGPRGPPGPVGEKGAKVSLCLIGASPVVLWSVLAEGTGDQ